jgi:hypothetical protein
MAEVLAISDSFSSTLSGTNWSTTTGWTTSGGLALNSAGNSAQPLIFNNTTLADSATNSHHRKVIVEFTAIHDGSGIELGSTGATIQGFFGLKSVNGNLMWVANISDYTGVGPGYSLDGSVDKLLNSYAECPAVVPGTDAVITSGSSVILTAIIRYSIDPADVGTNGVFLYVNSVRVLQLKLDDTTFSSANGTKIKNGYLGIVSGNSSTRITDAKAYTYTVSAVPATFVYLHDTFTRANASGYNVALASPTAPNGVLSSGDGVTGGRGVGLNISSNRLNITTATEQTVLNSDSDGMLTEPVYFEFTYISGSVRVGIPFSSSAQQWLTVAGVSYGHLITFTSTGIQFAYVDKGSIIAGPTVTAAIASGTTVKAWLINGNQQRASIGATTYTGSTTSLTNTASSFPLFTLSSTASNGVIDDLKVYDSSSTPQTYSDTPPTITGSFAGTIYHGFPQIEQGFI